MYVLISMYVSTYYLCMYVTVLLCSLRTSFPQLLHTVFTFQSIDVAQYAHLHAWFKSCFSADVSTVA